MSGQKTLLLIPPFFYDYYLEVTTRGIRDFFYPHLGIGYISEYLSQNGVSVFVIDLNINHDLDAVSQLINNESIDTVCISCNHFIYIDTVNYLINTLKKNHNLNIIVGGNTVSTIRSRTFELINADYAFFGEGEESLALFLSNRLDDKYYATNIERKYPVPYHQFLYDDDIEKWGDVTGVCYSTEDLDRLPFPQFEAFELMSYCSNKPISDRILPLQFSRGCPEGCMFCCSYKSAGTRLRTFEPAVICEQVDYFYKMGFRKFEIVDDNVLMRKQHLEETLKNLSCFDDLRLSFTNLSVSGLDKSMLNLFKDSGVTGFGLSVEHTNNKILKSIGKKHNYEQTKNLMSIIEHYDMNVDASFLIGSPGETYNDFLEVLDYCKTLQVNRINFWNLTPVPGTPLYNYVLTNNLLINYGSADRGDYKKFFAFNPLFQTKEFPRSERMKALALAHDFMDSYNCDAI